MWIMLLKGEVQNLTCHNLKLSWNFAPSKFVIAQKSQFSFSCILGLLFYLQYVQTIMRSASKLNAVIAKTHIVLMLDAKASALETYQILNGRLKTRVNSRRPKVLRARKAQNVHGELTRAFVGPFQTVCKHRSV